LVISWRKTVTTPKAPTSSFAKGYFGQDEGQVAGNRRRQTRDQHESSPMSLLSLQLIGWPVAGPGFCDADKAVLLKDRLTCGERVYPQETNSGPGFRFRYSRCQQRTINSFAAKVLKNSTAPQTRECAIR
jgi:hypothetical protein